jgi:thiamine transporter ThiT
MIRKLALWILVSMVAIAIVEFNALFGIAVAVAGGIVLGILLAR